MRQCLCVIEGSLLSESDPLIVDVAVAEKGSGGGGGGKKKKQKQSTGAEERMKTLNIQVLIPEVSVAVGRTGLDTISLFFICRLYLFIAGNGRRAAENVGRTAFRRSDVHQGFPARQSAGPRRLSSNQRCLTAFIFFTNAKLDATVETRSSERTSSVPCGPAAICIATRSLATNSAVFLKVRTLVNGLCFSISPNFNHQLCSFDFFLLFYRVIS